MPGLHRLEVEAAEAGQRIDRLLAGRLPGLSRSRCQQLIEEGRVTLEGVAVDRPSRKVDAGMTLEVEVPEVVSPDDAPAAQDLPLPILYQDGAIVVVDKPAGMAVHPAPGSVDGTVVNAILFHVPDLKGIGGELRPGVVHRLDKDTTGVLVLAKSDAALQGLQAQFKERTVEKVYLALARGRFDDDEGASDAPLARHPVDRKRFTGQRTGGRPDARAALTRWRVLRRFTGAAELEVRPKTGRTHQIRVHLAEAGHPLIGEGIYDLGRGKPGPKVVRAAKVLGHHALHAHRLSFEHPETGERMTFEAPLPPEWARAVEILSE
ncbi:MAG: RluA family pseudouridine synthase [Deltaproteobacteria bacterium]|nr:RluA family pseudouridine synthase [Deltaproteobacteria bacterium]